jgi:hypothetical protein
MEKVAATAISYVAQQTWAAQDNYMMVACILSSLDSEGGKALHNFQYSYLIDGTTCGPLLVKVLLLDCKVETALTDFFVCAQLGTLD